MAWSAKPLLVEVIGPLRLTDADGADWTPPGNRPKAILAALVTAPNLARSRAWIQDLLWSTRDPDQGSASLRQTLTVIRKSLPDQTLLKARGGIISLDTDQVCCDAMAETGRLVQAGQRVPEFAEGVDVRDQVFEDWIRDERVRFSALVENVDTRQGQAAPTLGPYLIHQEAAGTDPDERYFTEYFMEVFLKGLRDLTTVAHPSGEGAERGDLTVRAEVFRQAKSSQIRSRIFGNSVGTSTTNWTAHVKVTGDEADDDLALMRLAHRSYEATLEALIQSDAVRPDAKGRAVALRASGQLFDMSPGADVALEQDLCDAYSYDPRGIYLAQKAFLRTNQIVERRTDDPNASAEEARALITRAIAEEPLNAALNAAAAHVTLLLDDNVILAESFARRAIELNPSNPLGWSSLANALVRKERPKEAMWASERALAIARLSRFSYWWEMSASLVAAVNNDLAKAHEYATVAHAQAPGFKPPLRYLTALNFHLGDIQASDQALAGLKALEPDFELRSFAEKEYPTATLRQLSLRQISKIDSL